MEIRWSRIVAAAAVVAVSVGWGTAPAAGQAAGNPAFQGFLTAACGRQCDGPTARALLRTVERRGNDLENSESSLNPNQTAVAASGALARAQALAAETEKQLQELRSEDAGAPGADDGTIASFGPWSIFGNVEAEWFDQDRPAFANERGLRRRRLSRDGGIDYRLSPSSHIGLMLSYGETSAEFAADLAGRSFVPQDDAGGSKTQQFSISTFASFLLSEKPVARRLGRDRVHRQRLPPARSVPGKHPDVAASQPAGDEDPPRAVTTLSPPAPDTTTPAGLVTLGAYVTGTLHALDRSPVHGGRRSAPG